MSVVSISKGTSECWITFSCLSPQTFGSLLFKTNTRTHLIEKVSDLVWWRVIGGVTSIWSREWMEFSGKVKACSSIESYVSHTEAGWRYCLIDVFWFSQWTYMRMTREIPPDVGNCENIKMIVKWANQKCWRMLPFLKQPKEKNWYK